MKLNLFLIFLLISCNNGQIPNQFGEEKKIEVVTDSFAYHLKKLDSAMRQHPSDTIYSCCLASIEFMELKTGIETSTGNSFHGTLTFTKQDLEKWHAWYKTEFAK